jgi:hypothetical protein
VLTDLFIGSEPTIGVADEVSRPIKSPFANHAAGMKSREAPTARRGTIP